MTEQNAVEFLHSQHEMIRKMFEDVERAAGEARNAAWEPLIRLLAVHETAEEMVVYPAIRSADGGDVVAEARKAEEDEAKKVLTDLEKMDPASAEFEAAFAAFRTSVLEHAASEEREVFPLLRAVTDDQQLQRLGTMLTVAEGMAPTHPHKSAPESATGNLLVGPFVAMVDRARDLFRG